MPSGSEARLKTLTEGKIHLGKTMWPNCAEADVRFPPVRVYPYRRGFVSPASEVSEPPGENRVPSSSSSYSFASVDGVASSTVCSVPTVPKRSLFWMQDDTSNEVGIWSSSASGSGVLLPPRRRLRGKQRLAIEDSKG